MNMTNPAIGLKRGHVFTFAIIVLVLVFVITGIVLSLVRFEYFTSNRSFLSKQALNIAEAGVHRAINRLNQNLNYPGEVDFAIGEGVVTITVSGTGSGRVIEALASIPNAANPRVQKRVRVEATLGSTNVQFFYGIQVDGGGVTLNNNAGIYGNVFSNGNIIGHGGSFATGDVIVAGGLNDSPSLAWETNDTDQPFAYSSATRAIAQSFAAPQTGALNRISVLLAKIGNPTTNINVRIAQDSSNRPGSTISNGTATINHASVGSSPSWVDISFAASLSLTAGSKYWIVLSLPAASTSNHWNWRKDSSDGYAGETAKYSSGANSNSWADLNGDLAFRLWQGGVATKIEGLTIGTPTSGSGRANAFINTTARGTVCPNPYCIIDNPSPQNLPISDGVVNDWKQGAASGGTHSGDYNLGLGKQGSLGPIKIEGNLNLSNSAVLTLTGTIWVTGAINISNNAVVKLDPGYGEGSGIVVTDGIATVTNGAQFQGSGQNNSYVLLLSTRDAKNENSISVSNNSVGVIYYAARSMITFSNNARAKEATGWGITLNNNATITYESGLANTLFTSGPGGGWTIKPGSWQELSV